MAKKAKTNAKQKEKENIWASRWSRFNGNARNWLGALCEVTLSEQCLCAASGWRSPGQWLICAGCFTCVFSSAGLLQFFMPVHKLWRLLFILLSDSRTGKLLCSSETLSQRQFGGGMSPCLKAPPPTSIALFLPLLLLLLLLLPHLTDKVTPGCVNRSRQRQEYVSIYRRCSSAHLYLSLSLLAGLLIWYQLYIPPPYGYLT